MKNKWRKLFSSQIEFTCPYCLQQFPIIKATKEHEPPLSRQKELGASRILLACKSCNNEKGSLSASEYQRWKTTKDFAEFARLETIRNGNLNQGRIR